MAIYQREDVERLLPFFFNGGQAWAAETAPDRDMPKARSNPALGGTHMAEMVDLKRAWEAEYWDMREPYFLQLRYGAGWTPKEISDEYEVPRHRVLTGLEYDVALLSIAMTCGKRLQRGF